MKYQNTTGKEMLQLQNDITHCYQCPRLVDWREGVAREKVKRFQRDTYWGRPVPSFGDFRARLFVLGLAPAAHGGNRTGRMFTGDRSGDWLYRALYRAGFANQPTSVHRKDGLEISDCYISAVIHCAPPDNKPLPEEVCNCRSFLLKEITLLPTIQVVVALGGLAFQTAIQSFGLDPSPASTTIRVRKPKFSHGSEVRLLGGRVLLGSYHPSQQNTFTGRLTEEMLDSVFHRARSLIKERFDSEG